VDIFNGMVSMLRTGLGVGVLPVFAADSEPELLPVSAAIDELTTPLWILTHPDLRRTARIQAFTHGVGDAVAQKLQEFA
jgi:DNA-binding transcriptional LysR family regulator